MLWFNQFAPEQAPLGFMISSRATLTLKAHSLSDSTPVPAGTCGVVFVTAGTCNITTVAGDAVTIAGVVGTFIETGPLSLIRTGGSATVLAWVPLT